MMNSSDFIILMREMVQLVKAQEMEKAVNMLNKAQNEASTLSFSSRQETIHHLSFALFEAQKQKEALLLAIDDFADREKIFAQAQIKKICQIIIDPYIVHLRDQKRRLSKP